MSTLAFIIVCAVLLRLAVLFHVLASAGVAPLVYGDAVGYITLAQNLWQGLGFAQTDVYGTFGPEVFRTPGLPLLLAPFAGSSLGLSFYFVLLALAGGALLPSLSYKIALRYTSHSIALLTSLFVAFEPHLVFFSILPQTEMPFMLFAYGGFLLTLHASDIRNRLYALAGGVLLGYAVLIRPGFFPILFASVLSVAVYVFCTKKLVFKKVAVVALGILLVLTPWYVRTYRVTDTVALSGAGWRNVYTDYLASIYAIENHTDFSTEKRILKDQSERAGVATEDVNNPKSANALKEYALSEIWNHKKTVIKLEAVLLTSYFIHDGYYYEFVRLHLIPPSGEAHTSSTFALLNKGFAGVGDVLHELQSQYFIPIAGRIFTVGIFLLALAGFFTARGPYRFLFALVIGLSALTATVIGLGVESRLRLPVEPLLFMFASIAIVHVSRKWKKI